MPYVYVKKFVPYTRQPYKKTVRKKTKPFKWVPRKKFLANLRRKRNQINQKYKRY